MTKSRTVFLLTFASMAASACWDGPMAPSPTNFPGAWTLVSIQPPSQAERAVPGGATYTITFADGRVSARADCNTCVGSYTVAGSTLTLGPALACTRAACPTMAFESAYTAMLAGASTAYVGGGRLVLSSQRGTLRFTR